MAIGMQEWPLEMFIERGGALGGGSAALLVLIAALVVAATMGWRGPDGERHRFGRLGVAGRARPPRAPRARRWAIAVAAGGGLILGGAIGVQLGWVAAIQGGAIGVIVGALCGAGNPALSQLDPD